MLAAIWAQDENGTIGSDNRLPWHLPKDLLFFKQMTENNTIVMGRKTFEGMGGRTLPNRQTIVMTTDKDYKVDGVLIMHTIAEVLAYAQSFSGITFIAGGSIIYKEFLPYCDILYRTLIHHHFVGDATFPTIDWQEWTKVTISDGEQDEKNPYPYQFETYQRAVTKE